MIRIEGNEYEQIRRFFDAAAEAASEAMCLRAKCGSVIVSRDGVVIGKGFNAPPLGQEDQRTCEETFDTTRKPKYDLTCCVHAEWNAVIDACKTSPDDVEGSRLYFMRVDENGGFTNAGVPYCTTCSRFTMQAGVAEFALWNKDGADIYALSEYNQASYDYYR